jgi:hypothetical protein
VRCSLRGADDACFEPIFLILDGRSIHRAAVVKRYVRSTMGRLRLFNLPPHAPELNPDESVWNGVKGNGVGRRALRVRGDLKRVVVHHLRNLQRSARRLRAFSRERHACSARRADVNLLTY